MGRPINELEIRCRVLGGALLTAGVLLAGPAAGYAAAAGTSTSVSYSNPGTYEFTVPAGVTSITATVLGAVGGFGSTQVPGGLPAILTGTLPVAPGEQLLVGVGGVGADDNSFSNASIPGGIGGGGAGAATEFSGGGGGGGASLIAIGAPGAPFGDLLVAGGGGGAGGLGSSGGDAGAASPFEGGGPGTQTAGGAGGPGDAATGGPGSFGFGGDAPITSMFDGGGGGGGYYGGGAGGSGSSTGGGGGGGGSSYVSPQATNVSGPSVQDNFGNGSVSITYATPTADLATQAIAFAGTQPQGVASPAQPLTITNNGSAPLSVSGVELGGTDPADYLVDNQCEQAVAPGASCQVMVRFSPQAVGASSASLTVLTNAPTAPAPVALSGTGGALAQGPQGPQGPAGPAGPQGPAGPAGSIVCRNTLTARLLCSVEFAPGTYTVQGGTEKAAFRLTPARPDCRARRAQTRPRPHRPLVHPGTDRRPVHTYGHGRARTKPAGPPPRIDPGPLALPTRSRSMDRLSRGLGIAEVPNPQALSSLVPPTVPRATIR